MTRVGVVTARAVHAALWSAVLGAADGLEVVAHAADPASLDVDGDALDVVVLDLPTSGDAARAAAFLTAGRPGVAVAVVEDGMAPEDVVARVRAAEPNMTVLSSSALTAARGQLRTTARRSPVAAYPRLTPRELEVLESLSRGNSTAAIAAELRISEHTCRGHLRTLMAKLDARSRVEVLAFVAEHGLPPS